LKVDITTVSGNFGWTVTLYTARQFLQVAASCQYMHS
jgi:hypothetical protein